MEGEGETIPAFTERFWPTKLSPEGERGLPVDILEPTVSTEMKSTAEGWGTRRK